MSTTSNFNPRNTILQLSTLFKGVENEKLDLNIFTLPDQVSYWHSAKNLEVIASEVIRLTAAGKNVFYSTLLHDYEVARDNYFEKNPGKTKFYGRSMEKSAACMTNIGLDIDILGGVHAEKQLPKSIEEAMELLNELPIKPTMIVKSGGGLHVSYCFKEPEYLTTQESKKEAKELAVALNVLLKQMALKHGWRLDNIGNLASMLRVVGSKNFKNRNEPMEVEILFLDDNNRYSYQELKGILLKKNVAVSVEVPTTVKVVTESIQRKENEYPKSFAYVVISKCLFLQYCRDNAKTLSEPLWFAMICAIANCEDGEKAIYELSKPYDNYDPDEVDEKIYKYLESGCGPRTCTSISEITGNEFCKNCQHTGINAPITLGYEKKDNSKSLEEHLELAVDVVKKIKDGNYGAHLTVDSIETFSQIKVMSESEYACIKKKLQDAGAPIQDFNKKIKQREEQIKKKNRNTQKREVALNVENKSITGQVVPKNYVIRETGVFKIVPFGDDVIFDVIAHEPVVISRKFIDVMDGSEDVELCWLSNGVWRNKIVEREIIADARKLTGLSAFGFPVNSNNAAELVKYLADFEAENVLLLPRENVTSSMGWNQVGGKKVFLLGAKVYSNEEEPPQITFKAQSSGDANMAEAFTSHGFYEKWLEGINMLEPFPKCITALYASFAPPLLELIGCPNFCVELAHKTSSGKSTVTKIQASVWGEPNQRKKSSIVNSWNNTAVFIERVAAMMNGLPTLCDDTKETKDKKIVSQIIYTISNGRGKGRGNLKGFAATASWTTILLSTGEMPAVSYSADGGARARVLEITGKPFEVVSEEAAQIVRKITNLVTNNYGFASSKFIQYIFDNMEALPEWREYYYEELERFSANDNGCEVAGRLAEYMALLSLAGKLVHDTLEIAWPFSKGNLDAVWEIVTKESKDVICAEGCLIKVISWAIANIAFFSEKDEKAQNEAEAKDLYGRWDRHGYWGYLAIVPHKLEKIIADLGYNPEEIIRSWYESGWLEVTPSMAKYYNKQVSIQGTATRVYAIKRSAYDEVFDGKKPKPPKENELLF